MKRVYTIDIPMLTTVDAYNASTLLKTLQTIRDTQGNLLLAHDDALCLLLLEDATIDGLLLNSLLNAITNISALIRYDSSVYSQYISHQPKMTDDAFAPSINEAIMNQMCALHVLEEGKIAMLLLRASRWPDGYADLTTIKDKKPIKHSVLAVDSVPLVEWLSDHQPICVPWRHGKEERGTEQRPISSFKAGGDMKYAQQLLDRAYEETQEEQEYPKYLYTFDLRNGCFVQFRTDNNTEYHGMDIDDEHPDIPGYLHDKYHR